VQHLVTFNRDFSWQAQHLVEFNRRFAWQVHHLEKFKGHFSWQVQHLGSSSVTFRGRRNIFGEVQVTHFVAGAALGDFLNDSRGTKCFIFLRKCSW